MGTIIYVLVLYISDFLGTWNLELGGGYVDMGIDMIL
jgi:hypothetical protein